MNSGKGWRGYLFSRDMGGQVIPHRVQNLVIRDAAQKNGCPFLLSAVEYAMPGSFMILKSLIEERDQVDGLVFYNTHQLPVNHDLRLALYQAFPKQQKGLLFALENLLVTDEGGIALLEDILLCRRLSWRFDQPLPLGSR